MRPTDEGDERRAVRGQRESVSIVVPVYNSEDIVELLADRLVAVLQDRGCPFEIIFVNDGSKDGSWKRIEASADVHPEVRGITLMRNSGQHNAVLAGVRAARNDVIVTLDDDLQHPPEAIPLLLDALTPDRDLVYGRARREQHGWWRDAGSRMTKWGVRLALGWEGAASISDFRVFRTQLRDGFASFDGPSVSFDALLSWMTTSIAYVTVDHAPREIGRSNYRIASLVEYGATMATGFSFRPLRIALFVGLALIAGGLGTALVALVRMFITGASPQDMLIGACFAWVTSVQFLALGLIGEYLGRVYQRVQPRPAYLIREEVGGHTVVRDPE